MLFSEIYSAYYNTVASVIAVAQKGDLDSDAIYKIVGESAFSESYLKIGSALEKGEWPLIKKDFSTNIKNPPTMSLSLLQKSWLKAILADKRFKLFVAPETMSRLENDLQDCQPFFSQEDFYLYDKYSDGDPYDDKNYIENFQTILAAIHQNKSVNLEYTGRLGQSKQFKILPCKIEYSQKDDKFRCLAKIKKNYAFFNMARIDRCEISDGDEGEDFSETENLAGNRASVTLEIYDDRKAMERMMLAFAHFEKSAVQIDENTYRFTLNYDSFDEAELVIRVLSFGPMVKVIEPESFVEKVRKRIFRQVEMMSGGEGNFVALRGRS